MDWLVIVITLPAAIGAAFYMDKRLHEKYPAVQPYKWGYYNGWMGVLVSIIYAVIFFIGSAASYGESSHDYVGFGLLFMCLAVVSAGFILRNRWWIIASIVVQFNPILWIINGIYLKNRWHEMDDTSNIFALNNLKYKSKAIRLVVAASIFWVIVASAYVFLFEPYGWRIDWSHLLKVLIFPPLVFVGGYIIYKKILVEDEKQ